MVNAVRAAIESLYAGKCDVVSREKVTDEVTHQTGARESVVLAGQPCRLSFEGIATTESMDGAPVKKISAKLLISPDIDISPGSKIIVTQDGRTGEYKRSGIPAVYASHQEIMLEVFDKWA